MPNSTRMTWPYPSRSQQPWFEAFEAFVAALDASGYAAREDRQLVLAGGGTITWSTATSVLSWSATLRIVSPITGFQIQIPASSVTVDDGFLIYANLTRAPTSNVTATAVVAARVPPSDSAIVLAVRVGGVIYWRNGLQLNHNDSFTNIGASQGGGGGGGSGDATSIQTVPVNPSVAGITNGQVLQFNGTEFVAVTLPAIPSFTHVSDVLAGTNVTADTPDVPVVLGGFVLNPAAYTGFASITFSFEFLGTMYSSSADGRIDLYDLGPPGSPIVPARRSRLSIDPADDGVPVQLTQTMALEVAPGVDVDEIRTTASMYEVRLLLDAGTPGDLLHCLSAGIRITGTV